MGVVGTDTTLATADVDGVLFIAVQALEQRTAALRQAQAETAALKTCLDAAETRLARLETTLTAAAPRTASTRRYLS